MKRRGWFNSDQLCSKSHSLFILHASEHKISPPQTDLLFVLISSPPSVTDAKTSLFSRVNFASYSSRFNFVLFPSYHGYHLTPDSIQHLIVYFPTLHLIYPSFRLIILTVCMLLEHASGTNTCDIDFLCMFPSLKDFILSVPSLLV